MPDPLLDDAGLRAAIAPWRQDRQAMASAPLQSAPANEVVEREVDLYQLPAPVHALQDGGRYLDSSVILARNPATGAINSSVRASISS